VQTVTRDFDVQIKFPDKAGENGEPPAAPRPDRSSDPNIIRITGICQLPPVLVWIRIRGSMPLTNGSGSADPFIFIIDLQDTNKKLENFLHFTFTSFLKVKSQREVTKQ
jgi:hypothetical protein